MRRSFLSLTRLVPCLAVVLIVVLALRPAPAQRLGEEGRQELESRLSKHRSRFENLLTGRDKFTLPDDVIVSDTFARGYTSRLLWGTPPPHEVTKEFGKKMDDAAPHSEKNQEFIKHFAGKLVGYFDEIFKLPFEKNRLACVNGALMLPALAKSKQPEVDEFLIKIAKAKDSEYHEVIRFYALKGMSEFFPLYTPEKLDEPKDKQLQKKKRDIARVDLLRSFIERKVDMAPGTPPEVVNAVYFMRREIIKALAEAQAPAVEVIKGPKGTPSTVNAPVAYTLLRVLAPGQAGVTPEASLSEKCEAAIAVCRLKAAAIEDYNPDAAVYLVGLLLVEFVREYKEDHPNITFKPKINKDEPKKIPLLPWRTTAERLEHALKGWKENLVLPDHEAVHKKVAGLLDAVQPHLTGIKFQQRPEDPMFLDPLWQPKGPVILFKNVPEKYQLMLGN